VSFEVFFSSVAEDSYLLGYNTELRATQMPAFERNLLPSSSRVSRP
jgi:hypothetical protein